jgi:hypothetical protein
VGRSARRECDAAPLLEHGRRTVLGRLSGFRFLYFSEQRPAIAIGQAPLLDGGV